MLCSFVVSFTQGTENALQTLIKQHNIPVRKAGITLLLDAVAWKLKSSGTLSMITMGIVAQGSV